MYFDFSDKTYIIFGATGGIGLEIAQYLSNNCNASVILIGHSYDKLSIVTHKIKNVITSLELDVINESNVKNAFQKLSQDVKKCSPCAGMVYAIGIAPLQKISDLDIKTGINSYRINAQGFVLCLSEFLKTISNKNDLSSIVAISSIVGKITTYRQADYAASKAGLDQYIKFAAREYMGVARINSISPGVVETEMYKKLCLKSQNLRSKTLKSHPLGIIEPRCIAEMTAYLLSDSAKYMTGSDIVMDAGYCVSL